MVRGIDSFRDWVQGYEDQYAIIGGTACDLLMTDEGLDFRATKGALAHMINKYDFNAYDTAIAWHTGLTVTTPAEMPGVLITRAGLCQNRPGG